MDLTLPLATGDEEEVLEGLSGWDALEEADVLVVTATAVEEESDAAGEGATAQKKKKRSKAQLRDQMGKKDPYELLELEDLRWRATADDIRKIPTEFLRAAELDDAVYRIMQNDSFWKEGH